MIPGIFIAGTGTDVGKTVVAAGVLRYLQRHATATSETAAVGAAASSSTTRLPAMVMKPVQTGCVADVEGRMTAPDVAFVLRAAGVEVDAETMAHLAPYCFAPACSPHLAARMAGQRIGMERILQSARWLASRYRHLVVESAGGVLAPLNETQDMLGMAREMQMPVLLVGHSGLGTINHVLLSLEAIRRRNCPVLGVVLCDTYAIDARESYIHDDNAGAVQSLGKVAVTRVPYLAQGPGTPLDMAHLDACLEECKFLGEYRL